MTHTELYEALKSLNIPVAYNAFKGPVSPPYIAFKFAYSSDLMADSQNYISVDNYQVELYTKIKSPETEAKVQGFLKSLNMPYSKSEYYNEDENIFQIIYEIQLIGG